MVSFYSLAYGAIRGLGWGVIRGLWDGGIRGLEAIRVRPVCPTTNLFVRAVNSRVIKVVRIIIV
jgi:hypothetical protein